MLPETRGLELPEDLDDVRPGPVVAVFERYFANPVEFARSQSIHSVDRGHPRNHSLEQQSHRNGNVESPLLDSAGDEHRHDGTEHE